MNKPIKISAVSYLNSRPFIHGIEASEDLKNYHLQLDTPSVCAQRLINDEADVGLIPVASIPQLKYAEILTEYCIGADGPVDSVMLYSEAPLQKIKKIVLDYQSKTSVALVQLLSKKHWKINPQFVHAEKGYESNLNGTTAGIVIGDRTFDLKRRFKYKYDLAEEWKKFTGLPFVFACWVANKKLPDDFKENFNTAIRQGVENRRAVFAELQSEYPQVNIEEYLTTRISYNFDDKKKQALNLFLNYVKEFELV